MKCNKCWEQIVLVRSAKTGAWISCDPGMRAHDARRATVTLGGVMVRGAVDLPDVMGLEPHYARCRAVRAERRLGIREGAACAGEGSR